MKNLFAVMILSGALAGAEVVAQEHQHAEHKEKSVAPAQEGSDAVKGNSMKCCESMEKMGEMKHGMPMKGEMTGEINAKMAKMREMKEKMAEKMGEKGIKMQTPESKVEKNPTSKDAHQH